MPLRPKNIANLQRKEIDSEYSCAKKEMQCKHSPILRYVTAHYRPQPHHFVKYKRYNMFNRRPNASSEEVNSKQLRGVLNISSAVKGDKINELLLQADFLQLRKHCFFQDEGSILLASFSSMLEQSNTSNSGLEGEKAMALKSGHLSVVALD